MTFIIDYPRVYNLCFYSSCTLTLLVVNIELVLFSLSALPFLDHLSDVPRLVHSLDIVVHAECWPHRLGIAVLDLSFCHVYCRVDRRVRNTIHTRESHVTTIAAAVT